LRRCSITSRWPASTPPLQEEEQLANIRQIYTAEREALGVVAIGIERFDPPC